MSPRASEAIRRAEVDGPRRRLSSGTRTSIAEPGGSTWNALGGGALVTGDADGAPLAGGSDPEAGADTPGLAPGVADPGLVGPTEALGLEQAATASTTAPAANLRIDPLPAIGQSTTVWLCSRRNCAT